MGTGVQVPVFRPRSAGVFLGLLIAVFLAGGTWEVNAQDYQSGRKALERGDAQRARQIWEPLAAAGDADALNGLGWLYDTGKGVAEDNGRAMVLYLKATKGGNMAAPTNLAQMYASGDGV
ncbi:MAG TPA: sel1 repeat family protein, partial [Devosia sp.]|nr:sel1 repeat family protein [Devosia sp.]